MKITETIFLVIGLALLGGGGAWYYFDVERPLSWPTVDAVVVSSRVVNPRNPNQHKPELVLRVLTAGGSRQVTITGTWSSSSYDMVKSHVDRFAAGTRIEVAVNPKNDADVRYELGPTLTALIGPGILGLMGFIFAGVGLWTFRQARPSTGAAPPTLRQPVRAATAIFGAVGAIIVAIGIWLVSLDLTMLRSWETIDAESIAVRAVSRRTSVGTRPPSLMYDVQVTFRYEVAGWRFESQTTSGLSSSSIRRRDQLMQQFAPGTRHPIRYRPGDPNVIRYNLDYSFRTFMLSGSLILMGLIFIGVAALLSRALRSRRIRRSR